MDNSELELVVGLELALVDELLPAVAEAPP
jgi:hypothetical protein